MPKKKKQIQTHAKIEGTPSMLDQLMNNYNELARYGTKSEDEYLNFLTELNRADLEIHARQLGVIIVESTEQLRNKLINEFRSYNSLLYKPIPENPPVLKVSKKAERILAEGR